MCLRLPLSPWSIAGVPSSQAQLYGLNFLKIGLKRDTNKTPTCEVPEHAPQTNAGWWGEEGGTTMTLVYTLPRHVGVGCLWVLMEWFVWMWRVSLFLANNEARPSCGPVRSWTPDASDVWKVGVLASWTMHGWCFWALSRNPAWAVSQTAQAAERLRRDTSKSGCVQVWLQPSVKKYKSRFIKKSPWVKVTGSARWSAASCSVYMLSLFCKNMMMTCQQFPRIRYVSPCDLDLCPFSELVCDLLPRRLFGRTAAKGL